LRQRAPTRLPLKIVEGTLAFGMMPA